MSAQNRAANISKLQTLLKKAYKPIVPVENRPLMEHLLYACLLENAPYELADEALARLEQDYFDWNEVRVTTITELTEVLARLPDAAGAAVRLKKNLHGIFESMYTFDLEELRKLNLGKAVQKFERLPAMTPFVLAYITQHGLGGHAIPLDSAALRLFWLCDVINEKELKSGKVTGLERAIPKNKGIDFSSLLHQAAVAINMDPSDETARKIVLAINPDLDQKVADHVAEVKKRRVAKAKAKAKAEATANASKDDLTEKKPAPTSKSPAAKSPSIEAKAAAASKPPAAPKKAAGKASKEPESDTASSTSGKKTPKKSASKKAPTKSAAKKSSSETPKKTSSKSAAPKKSSAKTSSKKITKRKPR